MADHDFTKQYAANAITLSFSKAESIPAGASKVGGKPDVPPDFVWPYYEGEGMVYDNGLRSRPLSFMLQINCAEAAQYDLDGKLPPEGLLSFFYEQNSMCSGFGPQDAGSARVFYFQYPPLAPRDFPKDMEDYARLPERAVSFSSIQDMPGEAEFDEDFDEWEYETSPASKLLGYAASDQNEDCRPRSELATSGHNWGSIRNLTPEILAAAREKRCDWTLLLQLGDVSDFDPRSGNMPEEEARLCFGLRMFFMIRKADLAARRFERCWMISESD